jgi:hypothetical protein
VLTPTSFQPIPASSAKILNSRKPKLEKAGEILSKLEESAGNDILNRGLLGQS